jgi:large subunit ribosomal protein L23
MDGESARGCRVNRPIYQVLIRPLLTEKSVRHAQTSKNQQRTKYMFKVAKDATKVEIAQAVEEMFAKEKVKVASVNTMHVRGKQRRVSV